MSIITDTLNRLQSARAQHSARSRKPQAKSSESSERPNRPVPRPTGRSSKFLTITVLVGLTLSVMGTVGYWWGRNFITGPPPLTQQTVTSESAKPTIPTVGLSSTPTEMVGDSDGPVKSSAELTHDPETSLVQAHPQESQVTLTSLAPGSDSNAPQPIKGLLGPLQTERIHETPKTPPPAQQVKGTTNAIPQTHVVTSQPGPSSSVSSHNQGRETRSPQNARIVKKPAPPERVSPNSHQKRGQRNPSQVNNGLDRPPAPAESSTPNSLPTETPRPTPNVARASRASQHSSKTSPRYALTAKQRMTKGKFLIRKRLYEEAVKVLDPLFESQPSQWEPWFWMGTAHLGLRNLEQAETFLMEGLVRDDTVPHLWVQQGLVYQLQEQHEKAIGAFRQAQRLAPDLPEVHLNLAHVLESQDNGPLALKHYRQYLTLTEKALESRSIRKKVLGKIVGLEGS